jgi:tripartite-type tricarboxylate transporter receptor subunit TctC
VSRLAIALFALVTTLGAALGAEPWPARPVTIVVPYAPGGGPDVMARLLADALSPRLAQPVVVENHSGAGGLIGADYAAAAKPDGYTLFLGTIDTQAILGHLHPGHKPDPTTALAPISLLGRVDDVIAASPHLGITSFAGLLAEARKGRSFTYSTPGVGTAFHILGELIRFRENIQLTPVHYRVSSAGYADAMAGRIDLVISGIPPVLSLLKANKLIPLATSGNERSAALPDTPTLSELGMKGLVLTNWWGLLAPTGTPPGVITVLNRAIVEIENDDGFRKRLLAAQIEPVTSTPEEFGALIQSEYTRFGEVIERAKIVVN